MRRRRRVQALLLAALTPLSVAECGRTSAEGAPRPLPLAGPSSSAPAHAAEASERALFVGNSFTFVNDLPRTYEALAKVIAGSAAPPVVDSVAYPGYSLSQHLADAQGTGHNPRLSSVLGVRAGNVTWSHVLFQDQSEIPSFAPGDPGLEASIRAAVSLSAYAVARHATPVLLMTWGFPKGDPLNPSLSPDYRTMQSHLEAGYRAIARAITAAGRPVAIAPAGLAFEAVYDREVAGGRDPNAPGSLFVRLYGADAKHPAPPGTYLTACVVAATLSGMDPTTVHDGVSGVDDASKVVLRAIARDVVLAERARPAP